MVKHILYLASGSGRRFGSNKLLYEVAGKPMYLHGLELLQEAAGDCEVTVVSRYGAIRRKARAMGFGAVDSPESEKGISHTIRAAIDALGKVEEEDFLIFLVADQPYLKQESLRNLLAQAKPGTVGASLCWGETPGNPTLFSARLIPELLALEGDRGGRSVLKKHPCIWVQAQSREELEDIDTK